MSGCSATLAKEGKEGMGDKEGKEQEHPHPHWAPSSAVWHMESAGALLQGLVCRGKGA